MHMNRKGQALVEFIIILPIIIFLLFMIIDYGIISYNKQKLENIITDIVKMKSNNETEEEINEFIKSNDKDIKLILDNKDKYTQLKLTKKYNYITPGLERIFNEKNIVVERKIYNEQ